MNDYHVSVSAQASCLTEPSSNSGLLLENGSTDGKRYREAAKKLQTLG
jgi:hypothetical protein